VTNPQVELLFPLTAFYTRAALAPPLASQVAGEDVPEPYRQLLVHDSDMTPTLEAFHGECIHLQLLALRQDDDALWRQVVLMLDDSRRPVEFGAIVIYLRHFPPAAREEVLECRTPLGTILRDHHIEHQSRPLTFIQVASDAVMNEALHLLEPQALYGRRNVIRNLAGNELADIVEILPPVQQEQ
jgi:chorismate-pyruvate lyase